MAITISNITGSAQSGLTSPTYTVTTDTAPSQNGKQVAITALGGTQTGVLAHSVSSPFTCSVFRPVQLRVLPAPGSNGFIRGVPFNHYKVITRKGVLPAANQPAVTMQIDTKIGVPAGSDAFDVNSVRAALSAHIGLLTQISLELGITATTGTM